jgi:hypothetical protein
MIARLAVLACAVLCGNAAIPATQYGVDEFGVGAQLKFASASSREFCCNPSEQFESASGPTHIVRLEKPQSAAEATRIEATTASGARIGNQDTEEDRVGEPSDAHAVKPPSDAEQAAADAESSRWEKINWWESFAFGTIAGLLFRLAVLVIVLLQNRRREDARKHRPSDAWPRLIEAGPERRVGDGETMPRALSPEAALVRIEAIRRSLLAEAPSHARPQLDRRMVAVGA